MDEFCIAATQSVNQLAKDFPDVVVLLVILVGGILFYGLYLLLLAPLNRVRDLTDIGFDYIKDENERRGKRLKNLINRIRAQRKVGNVPPIYPNGWFAILESRDLRTREVKRVAAIGQNFAVFRSSRGEVYVLDAYCPHLGADLSVGGRVLGSCIECPFHGWQFDGKDGRCVHVPYSDKVPLKAKVKKWTSLERNGQIFVWFHAEDQQPEWFPPEIEEISKGKWVYRGRTEHYVASHIQDIPENGGDIPHLPQVHKPFLLAGVDLRFMRTRLWEFAQHVWEADWKEGEGPDKHIGILHLTHCIRLFGKIPLSSLDVSAMQIGPALVHLKVETAFGRGVLIQTVTPVGPLEMRMVHHLYANRFMPIPYSKFLLTAEAIMVERDIMIWNNKTYESKPFLIKEDRLLAKHRRWYSQFYSENSPKLKFVTQNSEW